MDQIKMMMLNHCIWLEIEPWRLHYSGWMTIMYVYNSEAIRSQELSSLMQNHERWDCADRKESSVGVMWTITK